MGSSSFRAIRLEIRNQKLTLSLQERAEREVEAAKARDRHVGLPPGHEQP